MSKSTRLSAADLEAMNLEEYEDGKYRPKNSNPRKENRDKVFGEWLNTPLPEDTKEDTDTFGEITSVDIMDINMARNEPISNTQDIVDEVDLFMELLPRIEKEKGERMAEELEAYDAYKKEKVYCGIDPGKSGAISFVSNDILHKWVIPIEGKDINASELYRILNDISIQHNPVIILEDVHSLFGMSAASNFSFGFVCGMIRAMVVANSLPFHMVAPKTWQKIMWTNDDKIYKPKKPEQKNPSIDTKATSLKAAKRIFPNFDFTKNSRSKVAHDGIVDAVLLSEYGRRLNL